MRRITFPLFALLVFRGIAAAQSFSSGSTGADGALDLSTLSCTNCEVQLPESGVLNYTTVNIPNGKILLFKKNLRNTPVTLLAQGNVNIAGSIRLNASGRTPGPGGFFGGAAGQNGLGPGAGTQTSPGPGDARWVGPLSLVPIVGGSGGFGVCANGGGGGGGAIVIASSASISLTGSILANSDIVCGSGTGAGGAIRLVANSINVSGGSLEARDCPGCGVAFGVIRLEAPSGSLTFNGTASPSAGLFPINPTVVLSASPSLTFVSIGGFPVPSYAGQRFDTYDMLLPNQLTDPISVVVQASNIPVGTQVTVGFVNGSPTATSTPGTLAGSFESSTATATISNLNRAAVTYLLATATFDPPMGAMKFNPKGPNHVTKIRIVNTVGGKSKFLFLRRDGTEVNQAKVSKRFLEQLGL